VLETNTNHFAVIVEYDGSNYHGFQIQKTEPTIQAAIETALYKLTSEHIRIRSASRTDAGAHAYGQVVDFRTPKYYEEITLLKALNYYLPKDISIKKAYYVPNDFHSRKSATSRNYKYQINNSDSKLALYRNYYAWIKDDLDVSLMNSACQSLYGEHDFKNIAKSSYPGGSTTRTIYEWKVVASPTGVDIKCESNGFLKYQIRKINGILVEIGKHKTPIGTLSALLSTQLTTDNYYSMLPACGLFLVGVKYGDPFSYIGE
jgi:tRNA pseudouridine38-40 synthase